MTFKLASIDAVSSRQLALSGGVGGTYLIGNKYQFSNGVHVGTVATDFANGGLGQYDRSPVPEPGAMVILGVLGLAGLIRRRRSAESY